VGTQLTQLAVETAVVGRTQLTQFAVEVAIAGRAHLSQFAVEAAVPQVPAAEASALLPAHHGRGYPRTGAAPADPSAPPAAVDATALRGVPVSTTPPTAATPFLRFNPASGLWEPAPAPSSAGVDAPVPGWAIWAKADGAMVRDASNRITQWGEAGGEAVLSAHATDTTRQPTFVANGYGEAPVVRTDGVWQNFAWLRSSLYTGTGFSVFYVAKRRGSGSNYTNVGPVSFTNMTGTNDYIEAGGLIGPYFEGDNVMFYRGGDRLVSVPSSGVGPMALAYLTINPDRGTVSDGGVTASRGPENPKAVAAFSARLFTYPARNETSTTLYSPNYRLRYDTLELLVYLAPLTDRNVADVIRYLRGRWPGVVGA
jgi:hypothetical protein